ncbi:glutathione S-transferase [Vibrio azureus]|uniref:Putative glutathione S-transferase n=1 Tax=Vibrio azureus NBRC 104587 TaxID=1219077 RepID=U3C7R2_9VIBR|nr:glutathione S-transferase family protein [Vibrio azureus]AUI88260.1 glutathione S-transferase [Vibrio azureus]GAD77414.1 putative glutathione S-transferase [Vibrio azureus NBRC 104587]
MLVYGDDQSGNCFKVKLLLSLLGVDHEWQHVNILNKETQSDEFLVLNPNGKIPTVVLDDNRVLCESNAILGYFAEGTEYLPTDRYEKAKVYEWLFFEQYSHEPYVAVARFIQKYLGMPEHRVEEYLSLQVGGNKALSIMDKQLSKSAYLVGEQFSIADIALYAYTHVAHEGGFDLEKYPNIQRWISEIQDFECYVGMCQPCA